MFLKLNICNPYSLIHALLFTSVNNLFKYVPLGKSNIVLPYPTHLYKLAAPMDFRRVRSNSWTATLGTDLSRLDSAPILALGRSFLRVPHKDFRRVRSNYWTVTLGTDLSRLDSAPILALGRSFLRVFHKDPYWDPCSLILLSTIYSISLSNAFYITTLMTILYLLFTKTLQVLNLF